MEELRPRTPEEIHGTVDLLVLDWEASEDSEDTTYSFKETQLQDMDRLKTFLARSSSNTLATIEIHVIHTYNNH